MTPPTLETIRAALACIPADLPRDEWARVAMALKSELGGAGFDLLDAWSARAEGYKSKDARDTWRSVKAGGKVGIGTLFRLAGLHGYKPSDTAPAPKPTPAEVRASVLAKAKRIARDLADRETRQRDAAAEAAEQWAQASDEGQSPYLVRKGVQGHGVRFAAGGALLVPMRDTAGELWNVQAIKPERPADGGPDKLFLRGGRKSGLLHWFGSPEGAPVLLVGEGYATCASVHEATGRPVAFDAGNLAHVAKAIGKAYSAALIVLCADNDHETEAKTGRNPGHEKATEAARAVRGAVVWPEGLPAGASDFNDLAAHAGPGAVRERIEAAIAQGPQGARKRPSVPKPSGEPNDAPAGPPEAGPMPWDRFHSDDTGVWFTEHDAEGRTKAPQWVCSPLKVTARTRDADESSWGYLLEFTCPLGKPRQWAMPARMLASDGAEYRAILLGLGLRIASGTKARNLLGQYLQTRQPAEIATCVDRIGWHGRAFVLPRETLQREAGDGEGAPERIVYQTDGPSENPFRVRGTLEAWRDKVAALCVGNTRLMFAACCAFAGPLVRPAGIASGGVHFRGESQTGKSTAQFLAASVYGARGYKQSWRATDNALESVAAQHCDGLLILDELAQVDAKNAGEVAYMLGNEFGKSRSTRTGQTRQRLTWRLLFLSTGEISLASHMAEGGRRVRAGQEVRMVDIPAEVRPGSMFETTHGFEGGAAFAQHIDRVTQDNYGHAGREWLRWCVANVDTLRSRVCEAVEHTAAQWVNEAAAGQVHSVGRRFALIAVAGELATEAGLTGWASGEATAAAR